MSAAPMGDEQPISDFALTLLAAGDSIAPRVLVSVYPIAALDNQLARIL